MKEKKEKIKGVDGPDVTVVDVKTNETKKVRGDGLRPYSATDFFFKCVLLLLIFLS